LGGGMVDVQWGRWGSGGGGGCGARRSRAVARPHSRSACRVCIIEPARFVPCRKPLQAIGSRRFRGRTRIHFAKAMVPVDRDRGMQPMSDQVQRGQLLHLVFGGELADLHSVEFRELDKLDIVGIYPNYAAAYV